MVLYDPIDDMVPPPEMDFVGGCNFKEIGRLLLERFHREAGLLPDHRVLDVGCGIGRVAIWLTQYLSERGSYEGFDVKREGIDWCLTKIAARYPHFRFQLADIYNSCYNPGGKQTSEEYAFPYEDASFDFLFLTSVFTHMRPGAVNRYVAECARVLKPGGRYFITFFLLNQEATRRIIAGQSKFAFPFRYGSVYGVENSANPDAVVAYQETYIRALFRKHGLAIHEPVSYGSWCGRAAGDFQDVLLGERIAVHQAEPLRGPVRNWFRRLLGGVPSRAADRT